MESKTDFRIFNYISSMMTVAEEEWDTEDNNWLRREIGVPLSKCKTVKQVKKVLDSWEIDYNKFPLNWSRKLFFK